MITVRKNCKCSHRKRLGFLPKVRAQNRDLRQKSDGKIESYAKNQAARSRVSSHKTVFLVVRELA